VLVKTLKISSGEKEELETGRVGRGRRMFSDQDEKKRHAETIQKLHAGERSCVSIREHNIFFEKKSTAGKTKGDNDQLLEKSQKTKKRRKKEAIESGDFETSSGKTGAGRGRSIGKKSSGPAGQTRSQ